MPRDLSKLCGVYHRALVKAIKDRVEQVRSKVASEWVKDWMNQVGGNIENPEEFRRRFQEFLEEGLSFADRSDVSIGDGEMDIDVEGCAICEGNELLRQEGETTFCPIIPTGMLAALRVHGRKATLEGVEKPGPIGSCRIKYKLG